MKAQAPMIKRHNQLESQRSSDNKPRRTARLQIASQPLREDLYAQGKRLRDKCPRQSHALWHPSHDRIDPVALMIESSRGRIPRLIPIRYGRMLQSPFTFYRGAALNMAADLAHTPVTGLRVQACGDCHLLNFGFFATPERREIFDINDFDETLPGPWEWDVKRLAASFVLACRSNGLSDSVARESALTCVRSYRQHMLEFSEMPVLDVWYASIDIDAVIPKLKDEKTRKRIQKRLAAARHSNTHEHHFPMLVQVADKPPRIEDNPPLIYHERKQGDENFFEATKTALAAYRKTLEPDRRLLLERFELRDVAIKVVGVGSVGTWCGIALLVAGDEDYLFLQIKEAGPSVLEAYAGKSLFPHHGERVVSGCRLMQSASDLFLGWMTGPKGRQFYVRQLRDMKLKVLVEAFNRSTMLQYAKLCAWTLARAHARSGQPAMISGYLGRSDKFDQAVADFSIAYADQSERDHKVLLKAVRDGRLEIQKE